MKRMVRNPAEINDLLCVAEREGHYVHLSFPKGFPCVASIVPGPEEPYTSSLVFSYPEDFSAKFNELYEERNRLVGLAVSVAQEKGLKTGKAEDPEDEEWVLIYIDLPTGQVSWHVHRSDLRYFPPMGEYDKPWDGHSTPKKYDRVLDFIRALSESGC